jgi:hypothetical protein
MHSASTGQHRACERVLTRVACLHVFAHVCSLALSHDCIANARPTFCSVAPALRPLWLLCFPANRRSTNHPPNLLNKKKTDTPGPAVTATVNVTVAVTLTLCYYLVATRGHTVTPSAIVTSQAGARRFQKLAPWVVKKNPDRQTPHSTLGGMP